MEDPRDKGLTAREAVERYCERWTWAGTASDAPKERAAALKAALMAEIAAAPPPAPRLHPNLPELYRRRVAELREALYDPALRDEAIGILRGLVDRVEITPDGKALKVEFVGPIANMLVLPTPSEAGRMARHRIAVKEVARTREQRESIVVPVKIPGNRHLGVGLYSNLKKVQGLGSPVPFTPVGCRMHYPD